MALSEFMEWIQGKITAKEIANAIEKSRDKVYKPCWDLKFCPYGILVELFPLPQQVIRSQAITRIEHIKKSLKTGVYSEKVAPVFQKEVDNFNPLKYPETEEEIKYKHEACKHFGHLCPVFFTGEYLENSEEMITLKADPSPLEKNQAACKNVDLHSYKCEACGNRLEDYEVNFDREPQSGKVLIKYRGCLKKGK